MGPRFITLSAIRQVFVCVYIQSGWEIAELSSSPPLSNTTAAVGPFTNMNQRVPAVGLLLTVSHLKY